MTEVMWRWELTGCKELFSGLEFGIESTDIELSRNSFCRLKAFGSNAQHPQPPQTHTPCRAG